MNFLKICLAVLFGFLLACALLPLNRVKAATGGSIVVKEAQISAVAYTLHNPIYGDVVGFSCASDGEHVKCYIASRD